MQPKHLLCAVMLALAFAGQAFAGSRSPLNTTAVHEPATSANEGPALATRYLKLLSAGDVVSITGRPEPFPFEDMPGMTAAIQIGGRQPSCLTATFSAQFRSMVYVRALLDDTLMQGHNAACAALLLNVGSFSFASFMSYTFWQCDVEPGPHTVQIQWSLHPFRGNSSPVCSLGNFESASVFGRTLIVEGR